MKWQPVVAFFLVIGVLLYALLAIASAGEDLETSNEQATITEQTVTKPVQDPELLERLKGMARNDKHVNNVSLQWVDTLTGVCKVDTLDGCYKDNSIYMKRNHSWNTDVMLAHEYLHHVWYADRLDEDKQLVSDLRSFYNNHPAFQNRLDPSYTEEGEVEATELFSYSCTEIDNNKLGPYITQKCDEYIDTSQFIVLY